MLPIGKNQQDIGLELNKINRHGLITGASGTGKTVTLKVMAEQMSKAGIPVFLADIKGDLASMAEPGEINENITSRLESLNITNHQPSAFPVRLWDVFGEQGTPVRTTISEMGPMLLGRLMGLNDTQAGILHIVFKIADDQGLLLLDLKDLQAILREVADNSATYITRYGNITKQSVGAIQRNLLVLEQQGADQFFGEPSISLTDFIARDKEGKGYVNILMAKKLFSSPLLYSTYLMWMLSELFSVLPEVGDPEKPNLVFFFDEAHLLINNAPPAFLEQVEQVVRLIRSKGVGVYFITQSPADLPDSLLGQLSNRVQHALRAYTPREVKAVKTAADTFRPNPAFDTSEAITQLKVGEALLSFLDEQGQPGIVERAMVRPPESKMSAVDEGLIPQLIGQNPLEPAYRNVIDRESAYEIIAKRFTLAEEEAAKEEAEKQREQEELKRQKEEEKRLKEEKALAKERERAKKNDPIQKAIGQFVNSSIRSAGRELTRGLMGMLKRR